MKNKYILFLLFFLVTKIIWAQESKLMEFTTASTTANTSFNLRALESGTTVLVDFGDGPAPYTINTSNTSVSGISSTGTIVISGEPSGIIGFTSSSTYLRALDFSAASGLQSITLPTYNNITSIVLPEETDNLTTLDITSNKIVSLDLSTYLNLTSLTFSRNNALESLILPGAGNSLRTLKGDYVYAPAFTRFNMSGCTNLESIHLRGCTNMEELLLPVSADNLSELTLLEMNLEGVLDVSAYSALTNLDCTYNRLTRVDLPSPVNSSLTADISDNRIYISDLPEGDFRCYYMPQRADYTLDAVYTTNDIIDLSQWYGPKKGTGYQYNGADYYSTFTWYIDGSSVALIAGEDYTVTDGCKFQFTEVPSGPVYCVIYNDGYPELSGSGAALKTNTVTIEQGISYEDFVEIMEFTVASTTASLGIRLSGSENDTPVLIDWGDGPVAYTVSAGGNTLSSASFTGTVIVYAEPSSITRVEVSNTILREANFKNASGLTYLKCESNRNLQVLILPEETGNLTTLNLNNNNLTTLDLSGYTELISITCSRNANLETIILPEQSDKLIELDCRYMENLISLDVSGHDKLEKILLRTSEKLEELILPENATSLKEIECIECNLTTLDLSKYVNLVEVDCSYNKLTSLLLPEEPLTNLSLTCYYNSMYISQLPEGPFNIYYTPQNVEYNLSNRYTTNELIDMSEWYVLKKGAGYYYVPNGAYPVFQWYLSDSDIPLSAGSDYTVVDGCKFRFSTVPEGSIYCVIYHPGYPEFKNDQALITNTVTIAYEPEPSELLVNMTSTATDAIEFIIASVEGNTEIEVEVNGSSASYTIEENGTIIQLNSGGEITIYGNPARVSYLDVSGINLTSLDVSGSLNLHELNCSNNELETLLLPESEIFKVVNCENNKLVSLDMTSNDLTSLNLRNNHFTITNLPYEWRRGENSFIYAPQADYVITDNQVSESTIDLSELYVGKIGVRYADVSEDILPEFAWYEAGSNTSLEAEKDYVVEENSKFKFIFEGSKEVYAVISTEAYPAFTGDNAYKTTSYTVTPPTGIASTMNDGVRVFAKDKRITIIANEMCEYTISTISGRLIGKGNVVDTVEFTIGEVGVYMVQIRKQAETKTYKVLVSSVK